MAKPFEEGKGWAMRRRYKGEDIYLSGFSSQTAVKKKMEQRIQDIDARGKPKALGPHRTTLAQGLQDYGTERLPFMKGARQEANRINRYLRCVGLATLKVEPAEGAPDENPTPVSDHAPGRLFCIELEAPQAERSVPRGLSGHRSMLASATAQSDLVRARLAGTPVAELKRYHLQEFIDALRSDKRGPSTIQLERSLLRTFFNHAHSSWNWSEPKENPATRLKLPSVDNERDRVMSAQEQQRLDVAIAECRNSLVGPVVALLRETAMRASEPLERARWGDVDWDKNVLHLKDAKAGKRDVPLSPAAIVALQTLKGEEAPDPKGRIVRITYEALKAAWELACKRAGIKDLRIHDLRHTAATRMALKTGNVFLVKALTGHKTDSQLKRYVNVKASDVVAVMHAPEPTVLPVEPVSASTAAGDPLRGADSGTGTTQPAPGAREPSGGRRHRASPAPEPRLPAPAKPENALGWPGARLRRHAGSAVQGRTPRGWRVG